MDPKPHPRQGFTLIELLVVIAILAILVAMLMPSLGRVRDIVQFTICRSKMKGVSSGWFGFAAAHEGRFPGNALSTVDYHTATWQEILNREWYHNNDPKRYPTRTFQDEPTVGPILKFWTFWGEPYYPNAELHKKWTVCPSYKAWQPAAGMFTRPWVANNYAVGGHYSDPAWGDPCSPTNTWYDYCKYLPDPKVVNPVYTAYRLGARQEKFKSPGIKYLMWDAEAGNDMDRNGGDTVGIMKLGYNNGVPNAGNWPPWVAAGRKWSFRHLLPPDKRLYQQRAMTSALYIDGHAGPVNPNEKVFDASRFVGP